MTPNSYPGRAAADVLKLEYLADTARMKYLCGEVAICSSKEHRDTSLTVSGG